MSGGFFQYQQYRVQDIAEEIQSLIDNNDCTDVDKWGDTIGYQYSPEVIDKFKEARITLERASKMAHHIDWLVSGDTGEESFLKRWDTIEEEIK